MYLLKSKDEVMEKFVLYKKEIKNQLNKKIEELRTVKDGESYSI